MAKGIPIGTDCSGHIKRLENIDAKMLNETIIMFEERMGKGETIRISDGESRQPLKENRAMRRAKRK